MASNLTRDEAHDRGRLVNVRSYRVDLDLTGDDEVFTSQTTVTFGCSRPGAGTYVDLSAPAVTEIVLNGQPVRPEAFDGDRIALANLAAGQRTGHGCSASCRMLPQRRRAAPGSATPVDGAAYISDTDLAT